MVKKLLNWYKNIKEHVNISVYYDRFRKGWFFRIGEERHGYRGSLDKGYENRQKALEAMKRFFKKNGEPRPPEVGPEPEPLITEIKYDRITAPIISAYRRQCYGGQRPPTDSRYVEIFGGFDDEWPTVVLTDYNKRDVNRMDYNSFSLLGLLNALGLQPVYDENDQCIGAREL